MPKNIKNFTPLCPARRDISPFFKGEGIFFSFSMKMEKGDHAKGVVDEGKRGVEHA